MIEGINILNQTEVTFLQSAAGGVVVFFMIAALVCFLVWILDDDAIFGFLSLVNTVAFILMIIFGPGEPTGRYRYEVTIDDSVNFTDVYERFEVIEQRGDIWVLEDKKGE